MRGAETQNEAFPGHSVYRKMGGHRDIPSATSWWLSREGWGQLK